jgi:hypothetical protein
MQHIHPKLEEEMARFKDSELYYFMDNLQMEKLVDLYEKREIYNYEAEYYDL